MCGINFVGGGGGGDKRTFGNLKKKCILKVQSKASHRACSGRLQYEKAMGTKSPSIRKFSAYEMFWIHSMFWNHVLTLTLYSVHGSRSVFVQHEAGPSHGQNKQTRRKWPAGIRKPWLQAWRTSSPDHVTIRLVSQEESIPRLKLITSSLRSEILRSSKPELTVFYWRVEAHNIACCMWTYVFMNALPRLFAWYQEAPRKDHKTELKFETHFFCFFLLLLLSSSLQPVVLVTVGEQMSHGDRLLIITAKKGLRKLLSRSVESWHWTNENSQTVKLWAVSWHDFSDTEDLHTFLSENVKGICVN